MSGGRTVRSTVACLLATGLAACGEEAPTEVGAGLLPGAFIRTIEVTLDAEQYLVADTAFSGFGSPGEVPFVIVADRYDGVLDAHALASFNPTSGTILVLHPETRVATVDSMPELLSAQFVVRLRARASTGPEELELHVHQIDEDWDYLTATWTTRIELADGTRELWLEPGGTRGELLGAGPAAADADSVLIPIEAQAALDMLLEEETAVRGVMISATGADTRLRIESLAIQLEYRSSVADTVVTLQHNPAVSTFVFDPPPEVSAGAPRIGGVPDWRTFLHLIDRFDTLTVACPDRPGCRLALGDVGITRATLLLDRVAAPAGFAVEDSVRMAARMVITSELVPLLRSPLGDLLGLGTRHLGPGDETGEAAVDITELVRRLSLAPDARPAVQPPFVALLAQPEGGTFGHVAFAPGPRLRLRITYTAEVIQ